MHHDIKRAIIIVPPLQDFYFTPHRFSTIGAQIVHKIVSQFISSSQFINFPLIRKKPLSANLPKELSYLKTHLIENETGRLSFFTKYKHFGPSIDDCADMIIEYKPDLCLVSCFAYCYASSTMQLVEQVKKRNKELITIIGGAGVSAYPQYFLISKGTDYVVTREAETSLPMLLRYLLGSDTPRESIPNIGWKENDSYHFSSVCSYTSQSQIQPFITQTSNRKDTCYVSTTISRGCSFQCQFCSNRLSQGSTFRNPEITGVIGEIKKFAAQLSPGIQKTYLNFEDDNVLLQYEYLKDVLLQCKRLLPNVQFSFENGIDYRLLTVEKCIELINMGVRQFNFSIGSKDSLISSSEKRFLNLNHLDQLYDILKEHAIPVITYFICGFQYDTHDSVIDNLAYLYQRPTNSGISLFYAVPGLEHPDSSIKNYLSSPCLFAGTSAFPWNNSLSTSTLITAFRLSRLVNLMKSENKSDDEKLLLQTIFSNEKLFTFTKDNKNPLTMTEVQEQDLTLVKKFIDRIIPLIQTRS